MSLMGVPLVPVLLAALATMAVGFLWYSPMLFARPWMIAMGLDPDDKAKLAELQKGAGKTYFIALVCSLVSAFVLSKVLDLTTVDTIAHAAKWGFALWAGFVATVQLTDVLFGKRPFKLYLINTGYQMVCYIVMASVLVKMAHR